MAMSELSLHLHDDDLATLVKILMPGHRNPERMIRVLRDDRDILEGMIRDDKVFRYLLDEREPIIRVSPHLFFTVLLHRVKNDLETRAFTVESENRQQMVVFDSDKVYELLDQEKVVRYLIDMLTSFIRINSFTIPIRVKKGIWRKLKVSDFDIDSLMQYSQILDQEHRLGPYKRIADICLFITGVFPESVGGTSLTFFGARSPLGITSGWDRAGYERHGRFFYSEASRLRAAHILELDPVLSTLSEHFSLAAKPLSIMSSRYLGLFKDRFFLQ
jgi:hypothetical protein